MMKSIIYLFFGFLQIISETFLVTGSVIDIKIIPETAYMVALEGAEIKLDCIVEFKETTDVNVNFYKDGVMIPVGTHYGYNVIVSQTFIASLDLYRTTTTLIKNVTDADDRGSYECRVQIATEDGTYMNRIEVVTFTASGVDRELQEDDGETAEFPCIINIKAAKVVVEHTIFWERNGTRLADDDKYKITNTTLQISKPTREDLGAYQCVVVMFPTSMVEKQTVRINPFFLKASPKIESHDSDKNMVLGDNLELKCKVSGYPTPIVTWFKDEKEIKTTSRIHILENEGAMGKLMIHSLEDEDEGIYKCLAKNEVVPFNADAKMTVRVEGQYVIDLTIVPEKTYMLTLERAELRLDCIVHFKGTPYVKAIFYKDGTMLPVGTFGGYHVTVNETFIASLKLYRTTKTLIKNVTDASDRGKYQCRAQKATGEGMYSSIEVITFTAGGVDVELQEEDRVTVEFLCNINIKTVQVIEHTISWERNGTHIVEDDKYKISNNTLQIFKPTRADLGAYQCVVVMFPTSMVEKQTVRIKPFYLKACPKIESHDSDKNMVTGDNLELKCKVSGYPTPIVSWFKDEKEIETTSRINILEYEGAMGKLLITSLEDEDEGIYKCLAKNEVVPFNADAKMTVRVEGKNIGNRVEVGAIVGYMFAALACVALIV